MKIRMAVLFLLSMLALSGCARKSEPAKIAEWTRYDDPYFKAHFSYPKGWHLLSEGGRVTIYSSPEVVEKFYDPTSKGKEGVQLIVTFEKLDTLQTLEGYAGAYKNDLTSAGYTVTSEAPITLDDVPGSQVQYTGYHDERTRSEALRAFTIKDSVLYYVNYAGFNDLYGAYRAVYDTLIASLKLPKAKAAEVAADPSIPSTEFVKFANNFLEIFYPDNFETFTPQPKGEVQFSLDIKGYRQDSNVHLDILPAKGLTVDKVLEQNAKFFKGVSSRRETTIDGSQALYINYLPIKGIESRAYFLVKNDRVYRVIMNYHQPAKQTYLPVFEKTVASLKIK